MKIEELMIGDWVKTPANPYYQVVLGDFWREDESNKTLFSLFSPLPLTPEILEKNGFEGSPKKDMYLHIELWERCQLKVELCQSEGLFVFVYTDKAPIDMYVNHILLHIRYAHELQHALRLCGLNDLANNFKL